jgi:hypothetical protein
MGRSLAKTARAIAKRGKRCTTGRPNAIGGGDADVSVTGVELVRENGDRGGGPFAQWGRNKQTLGNRAIYEDELPIGDD